MTTLSHNAAKEMIGAIVGERCWWAALVNGEYLQMELGDERPQPGGLPLGGWGIIIGSKRWTIDDTDYEHARSDADLLVGALEKLKDEVATVDVGPPGSAGGLEVTFQRGARLVVGPDPARSPQRATWEIFTPEMKTIFASSDEQLNVRDSLSTRR